MKKQFLQIGDLVYRTTYKGNQWIGMILDADLPFNSVGVVWFNATDGQLREYDKKQVMRFRQAYINYAQEIKESSQV